MDRPGIQYPSLRQHVHPTVDNAIRNVFENLFSLRNRTMANEVAIAQMQGSQNQVQKTVSQVASLVRTIRTVVTRTSGPRTQTVGDVIVGTSTKRQTLYSGESLPQPGTLFFETDTQRFYIVVTDPDGVTGWEEIKTRARLQYGLYASRPAVTTTDNGLLYYATDQNTAYIVDGGVWVYQSGIMSGTITPDQRPALAAGDFNFLFYGTDTHLLYRWTGAAWDIVRGEVIVLSGTYAARPAVGADDNGLLYYATDQDITYIVEAGAWAYQGGVMTGTLYPDQRPALAAADIGALFFATDKSLFYIWSGTAWGRLTREILTANATKYVRSDGSDSNSGDVDSADGAWLTLDGLRTWLNQVDGQGYSVTCYVRNGTYTEGLNIDFPLIGISRIVIEGDTTTPSNVVINPATDINCLYVAGNRSTIIDLKGFKLINSNGNGILAYQGAFVRYSDIEFGACSAYHVYCRYSALTRQTGDVLISGNAIAHITVEFAYVRAAAVNIEFDAGTEAFTQFILAISMSYAQMNTITFINDAGVTGSEYTINRGALVYTNGAGAGYFPGNAAGTTATGGQYF